MMVTTTAAQWREKRQKGVELLLPDYGDVVFIRPMDAGLFFKAGRIPDFLNKTVSDLINGTERTVSQPKELTPEQTKEWLTWLDELVKWTFVSPEVVDDPGDNQLGVDEVSLKDKLYVYSFFGQPAAFLRSFRQQQVASVATVDAAKNNGTHAVETVGSAALGKSDPGDA